MGNKFAEINIGQIGSAQSHCTVTIILDEKNSTDTIELRQFIIKGATKHGGVSREL